MFRDFTKYEVYDDGRIWSYKSKKFLKPFTRKDGYQIVRLSNNEGKRKTYQLHRVVYESVTGEQIPEGMQCNHIDERKDNNAISNLNLMYPKENTNWGTGILRCHKAQSKQVGAFKNGELIMVFPSTMEAQRNGYNQGNVAACCRGERNTHKGYTWRYI